MTALPLYAEDWRTAAACRTEPPDLWFPIGSGPYKQSETEQAKAVCRRCPVRERCYQWSLDRPEPHGIWGGVDEHQRAAILRQRGAA